MSTLKSTRCELCTIGIVAVEAGAPGSGSTISVREAGTISIRDTVSIREAATVSIREAGGA